MRCDLHLSFVHLKASSVAKPACGLAFFTSTRTFYSVYIWLLLPNFHSKVFYLWSSQKLVNFLLHLLNHYLHPRLSHFKFANDLTSSLPLSWGRPPCSYHVSFILSFKQLLVGVSSLDVSIFLFLLFCLTWMSHFDNCYEKTCG